MGLADFPQHCAGLPKARCCSICVQIADILALTGMAVASASSLIGSHCQEPAEIVRQLLSGMWCGRRTDIERALLYSSRTTTPPRMRTFGHLTVSPCYVPAKLRVPSRGINRHWLVTTSFMAPVADVIGLQHDAPTGNLMDMVVGCGAWASESTRRHSARMR